MCLTDHLYDIHLQYLSKVRPLRLPLLELRLPHAPCPLCRQGPGLSRFHLHFIFIFMLLEKKKFPTKYDKRKRESRSSVSGVQSSKKYISPILEPHILAPRQIIWKVGGGSVTNLKLFHHLFWLIFSTFVAQVIPR